MKTLYCENMTKYGNYNYLSLHSKVKATVVHKIASYIQMVWLIKLKFKIGIFEMIVNQTKIRYLFLKIGPCTLKKNQFHLIFRLCIYYLSLVEIHQSMWKIWPNANFLRFFFFFQTETDNNNGKVTPL